MHQQGLMQLLQEWSCQLQPTPLPPPVGPQVAWQQLCGFPAAAVSKLQLLLPLLLLQVVVVPLGGGVLHPHAQDVREQPVLRPWVLLCPHTWLAAADCETPRSWTNQAPWQPWGVQQGTCAAPQAPADVPHCIAPVLLTAVSLLLQRHQRACHVLLLASVWL